MKGCLFSFLQLCSEMLLVLLDGSSAVSPGGNCTIKIDRVIKSSQLEFLFLASFVVKKKKKSSKPED